MKILKKISKSDKIHRFRSGMLALYLNVFRKRFEFEEVIWIISAPRSGSTWLQSLIEQATEGLIMFEPLHPKRGTLDKEFLKDRYFEKDFVPKLEYGIKTIGSNSRWNSWTYNGNKLKNKRSKILLVKSVRLMPSVPALVNIIERPIVLFRHPCAIAFGQANKFGLANTVQYELEMLRNRFSGTRHEKVLNEIQSIFDLKLFNLLFESKWHNELAAYKNRARIFFYEECVLHPQRIKSRILETLIDNKHTSSTINFEQRSFTAGGGFKSGLANLVKWRNNITERELSVAKRLFHHFDYVLYSVEEDYPNKELTNE